MQNEKTNWVTQKHFILKKPPTRLIIWWLMKEPQHRVAVAPHLVRRTYSSKNVIQILVVDKIQNHLIPYFTGVEMLKSQGRPLQIKGVSYWIMTVQNHRGISHGSRFKTRINIFLL